jgi:tetratricopeptide (TPR) repeat protein
MDSPSGSSPSSAAIVALRRALERQRAGDAAGAIAHYEAALALDPGQAQAWVELGQIRVRIKDYAGATEALTRGLNLQPADADAQGLLGAVLLQQGRTTEAIGRLQQAVLLKPKSAQMQFNLGMALERQGDLAGAEAAWRAALEADHCYLKAANNLAVHLDRTGRSAEALSLLRVSLKDAQPGMPDLENLLGNLSNLVDRSHALADVISICEKAITLAPADARLRIALGTALKNAFDLAGAEACYRQINATTPKDKADVLGHLASISAARGNFTESETLYQQALAIHPENMGAIDGLALVRQRLCLHVGFGFQGSHMPARQIFMSATVELASRNTPSPRILEIGSYLGASAVTWARALDRFCGAGSLVCVDTWGDSAGAHYLSDMEAGLNSGSVYQMFLSNMKALPPSVTFAHMRGLSGDVMATMQADSFEIVYLDGSHVYEAVKTDLREADRLLKIGGYLCGDDLELQGEDCDLEFARSNLEKDFIFDPRARRHYHPGVMLAIHEAIGWVTAYDGFWIAQKQAGGYRPVSMKDAIGVLPRHWPKYMVDKLRDRFATSRELREVVEPRL